MKFYRKRHIKIHKEGTTFIVGTFVFFFLVNSYLYFAFDSKVAFAITLPISAILFGLTVNFFRSPRRYFPFDSQQLVVAPADGRVVVIEEVYEPEYLKEQCVMVSIFMSIFNVHANWFPVDGTVLYTRHHRGNFMAAYLPKSSVENERSTIVIRTTLGHDILVRQVAGAVAKRIVTYAREGIECSVEEQMGFIKFGSRVDVYIPRDSELLVHLDETTTGGQTVLARLPQRTTPRKS